MKISSLILALACFALVACKGSSTGPVSRDEGLTNTYAYIPDGPYSDVLKACVTASETSESCRIGTLPPLGMDVADPTVDDVMNRLVVSHSWMGVRFRELLGAMPDDMLRLLGGVTAVVIDDDIRPSYYWNLTGAIYLDPAGLWLLPEEAEVINEAPDYRAAYADPMSFRGFARYHIGGQDIYSYYLQTDGSRTIENIVKPMAALLFHELAHANDLFPRAAYDSVDRNRRFYSVSSDLYGDYPSTWLTTNSALQSDEMFHIADVLFRGVRPSVEDTQVSAAQVGAWFNPDRASDEYGYSSQYEDLAMLFEEVMMKMHFSADRDLAYVSNPAQPSSCDSYVIGWGMRNRISADQVQDRAQWVTEQLLPSRDHETFFQGLPAPRLLPVGAGWCESATPNLTKLYQKGPIPEHEVDSSQPLPPYSDTRPYKILLHRH